MRVIEALIQVFSIRLEVAFPVPRPFAKESIDLVAKWLTDPAWGFSLRADQVRARHTDIIFDYELTASLYGGNAKFHLDAEKTSFFAQGARTQSDAVLLREASNRFATFMASEAKLPIAVFANAHALLPSPEVHKEFVGAGRLDPRIAYPGMLGYVRLDDWPEQVRVAIEPSLTSPEGLFFSWQTNVPASDDWLGAFDGVVRAVMAATEIYGVTLKTLPAQ